MEEHNSLQIIDLENLTQICKGEKVKIARYLNQFLTLVPNRIQLIREAIAENNLLTVRKEVHKMSPQAEFFGIHQVVKLKQILEIDQGVYGKDDIERMIYEIITILERAIDEINSLLINEYSPKKQ